MPTHDPTWQADADEVSAEYVARCPACGDPIDYCQGHGDIGDPAGRAILDAHDNGDHSGCHPAGCGLAASTDEACIGDPSHQYHSHDDDKEVT